MNRKARRAAAKNNSSNTILVQHIANSLILFNSGELDWKKLIADNEDFATDLMSDRFETIDGDTILELLSHQTPGDFYADFFARLTAAVANDDFVLVNNPIWLHKLKNYALYELLKNGKMTNVSGAFLYLSAAGYYDENSVKSTDYYRYACIITQTISGDSWTDLKMVLDWVAENTDDRWLTDSRMNGYSQIIEDPDYTNFFSPEGRTCMDKLKTRWEYLKLVNRHQDMASRFDVVINAL